MIFVFFSIEPGLLGTAQIDAETSLLAYIDDAMRSYELKVNSSIMRRALKSLINDDFKLGAWSNLVSVSKKTIDERFLPADDGVTADDFYMLMCSQILQKMLRTATQKFKPKDIRFLFVWLFCLLPFVLEIKV